MGGEEPRTERIWAGEKGLENGGKAWRLWGNQWRNMKDAVKGFLRERKERDNGLKKSGTSRLTLFLSPVKNRTEEEKEDK